MTDDDALIAKAAEALRPYVPPGNGWLNASTNALFEGNCHKAAVAVVEAVRNQIAAEALREAGEDPKAMQAVRLHLEDELVEWRDAGRFMLRNNGFAIRGRDGSKPTIRFGTELGVRMALRLLADRLDPRETP